MTQISEKGIFVVGTGTDVGKTYVSCLLASKLRQSNVDVGVYKPVASGCVLRDETLISEDATQLWIAAGKPKTLDAVTPQRFQAAVAPNVAARGEGRVVDRQLLRTGLSAWDDFEFVIVEGVGGLLSPLSDCDLVADLAVDLQLPMLLVVANRLGCINETLLSLEVMNHRGLRGIGVVLNDASKTLDASAKSNRSEIERLSAVPVWDHVRFASTEIDLACLGV